MRLVTIAVAASLLGFSPALAERTSLQELDAYAQAEQPSMTTRAGRWTRARLEAAKRHWAQDQARFSECVVKLDELKKKTKRRISYHDQGHFLQNCMMEKH